MISGKSVSETRLIVFDFDGVMTDNRVLVDETGKEAVWVNRADGLGVKMIKNMDIRMLIISTETNPVVDARAGKLNLEVKSSVPDKADELRRFCREENIDLSKVIYVGNDINDVSAMKLAGIRIVPNDAYDEVKDIADIVLKTKGGHGVVRELAGLIAKELKEKGEIQDASEIW